MPAQSFVFLKPLIDHLRGHAAIPGRTVRLIGPRPDTAISAVSNTVMMQMFLGRLSLVTAVPIAAANGTPTDAPTPMVMTARFLEDTLLGTIGHQVGLANLRMVSARVAPMGDHVFDIPPGTIPSSASPGRRSALEPKFSPACSRS